jgi:hypothetical protein
MKHKLKAGQFYLIEKTGYVLKVVDVKNKIVTLFFTNNKQYGKHHFGIEENNFKTFGQTKLIKQTK